MDTSEEEKERGYIDRNDSDYLMALYEITLSQLEYYCEFD